MYFALLLVWTSAAAAQSATRDAMPTIAAAFAVPIDIPREYGDDLARGVGPALWAAASFPITTRVNWETGIEWGIRYQKEFRRGARVTGKGTYQETVMSQLAAVRLSNDSRTDVIAFGGFGLVLMRVDESVSVFTPGFGSEFDRRRDVRFDPSVIGGVSVARSISKRADVLFRISVRATRRRSITIGNEFSSLNVAPAVGFRIGL